MLPAAWVSQINQSFGIQETKTKTTVHHQPRSIPLPAWIIGQRIKLRGPDDNVLQVSPVQIWTEESQKKEIKKF